VVVAAMVSTTTSWVSSGRPRQFMVIAENIRCSIWGEMQPAPPGFEAGGSGQ
jgi:hypothetical protein